MRIHCVCIGGSLSAFVRWFVCGVFCGEGDVFVLTCGSQQGQLALSSKTHRSHGQQTLCIVQQYACYKC